jgi:hypothetical protein
VILALISWTLGAVCALLAVPAPNGFPLLLVAAVLYSLGWCFYKPKGLR